MSALYEKLRPLVELLQRACAEEGAKLEVFWLEGPRFLKPRVELQVRVPSPGFRREFDGEEESDG